MISRSTLQVVLPEGKSMSARLILTLPPISLSCRVVEVGQIVVVRVQVFQLR
jgi:hypothetical protein